MSKKSGSPPHKTGFSVLDELLGGGIPQESVVLISGRPGTGKTTLALQMLASAALRKIPSAFLTFDESPELAFNRFYTSYNLGLSEKHYIYTDNRSRRYPPKSSFIRVVANPSDWLEPLSSDHRGKKDRRLTRLFKPLAECGIWVIDGVNVLIEKLDDVEFSDIRGVHTAIRDVFLDKSGQLFNELKIAAQAPQIVILTSEAVGDRSDHIYESYMADVVIELSEKDFSPSMEHEGLTEKLRVCSVAKARGARIQRREVSYEFLSDKGLKFYPTYPAKGEISLFVENAPQRQIVQDFKTIDLPSLYPGLTVREFGRGGMFHEYAVRRRDYSIPQRFDNRTSSLDEYWTRNLRSLLAELPTDELRPYDKSFDCLISEIWQLKNQWLKVDDESVCATPYLGNIGLFVVNRRTGLDISRTADGVPYVTWEQIERYCREADTTNERPLVHCEMKTIESLVAFALEVCWSHRGGWYTHKSDGKLSIRFHRGHDDKGVVAALEMLRRWIHDLRIIAPYSTLSPGHRSSPENPDFARHWYSTLVESLTAQAQHKKMRSRDIHVLPIPIPASRVTRALRAKDFHCCWGEWYIGAWRGTENVALTIELANTVTSSRWQINASITGAGLPVYEPFFDEFSDARCFATDLTFGEIRKYLYSGAISRAAFSEPRFAMQRFYAALMTIVNKADVDVDALWESTKTKICAWESSGG